MKLQDWIAKNAMRLSWYFSLALAVSIPGFGISAISILVIVVIFYPAMEIDRVQKRLERKRKTMELDPAVREMFEFELQYTMELLARSNKRFSQLKWYNIDIKIKWWIQKRKLNKAITELGRKLGNER